MITEKTLWRNYFKVYDKLNILIPYRDTLHTIVRHLKPTKDDVILELGPGTGNLYKLLIKSGADVTGIDFSQEATMILKEKIPTAQIIVQNLEKGLPFDDRVFTKVVANNVIYALPKNKQEQLFREILRVLTPGGMFIANNMKKDFSPMYIYLYHIKKILREQGLTFTVKQIIKFILPTVRIFYYNHLIKQRMGKAKYHFFPPGMQAELLRKSGFTGVSKDYKTYASQAVLNIAYKRYP